MVLLKAFDMVDKQDYSLCIYTLYHIQYYRIQNHFIMVKLIKPFCHFYNFVKDLKTNLALLPYKHWCAGIVSDSTNVWYTLSGTEW